MSEIREHFLQMISRERKKTLDPVEMLHWTYLYVFIKSIPDKEFEQYLAETAKVCSK